MTGVPTKMETIFKSLKTEVYVLTSTFCEAMITLFSICFFIGLLDLSMIRPLTIISIFTSWFWLTLICIWFSMISCKYQIDHSYWVIILHSLCLFRSFLSFLFLFLLSFLFFLLLNDDHCVHLVSVLFFSLILNDYQRCRKSVVPWTIEIRNWIMYFLIWKGFLLKVKYFYDVMV